MYMEKKKGLGMHAYVLNMFSARGGKNIFNSGCPGE